MKQSPEEAHGNHAPRAAVSCSTRSMPGAADPASKLVPEDVATRRVATSYVGSSSEAGSAAPGIDLVERSAAALCASVHELLPATASPDTLSLLKERATKVFDSLLESADRETLLMVCPLLARLAESPTRKR